MSFEIAPGVRPKRLTIETASAPRETETETLAEAVRLGLEARPRTLPWTYFYDEVGSQLFEAICALPEYYLTRTEDAILREHAHAMVAGWSREPAMIELGSGSSSKTKWLIAAAISQYGNLHYVPIDVSPAPLIESAQALVRHFSAVRVTGYVANYRDALATLPERIPGPRLWVFLGSSLGNYAADEACELLTQVAAAMGEDDRLLLGTDLAKDAATLEAAYDDAAGVTARFNLNLLTRINRELGADFDLDRFTHRAVYRPELGRVEMHLVSRVDQIVRIPGASLTVELAAGELIHTENSHKYSLDGLAELAHGAGFAEEATWTDRQGLFRVQRWRLRD
ncbi:dimethylhistidine N-methyltransferase [Singulisphaera sp. GP187]|uniref:L-histidine N(alpha)-methyltransferase n=1 Tax=Singulisphaera sp. GP187 TaxID=1882752 RepID=UPI00092C0179|nr:L-histidine N(alpha)-methyltransferase [Singulisphaera sp. GP187]SIO25515.1 dimethylhistidine N-methyltransferase [Singulisphaera sp. GP187]